MSSRGRDGRLLEVAEGPGGRQGATMIQDLGVIDGMPIVGYPMRLRRAAGGVFLPTCGAGVWRWCVALVCGAGVWRWCVAGSNGEIKKDERSRAAGENAGARTNAAAWRGIRIIE
jgi:hypothetical protein